MAPLLQLEISSSRLISWISGVLHLLAAITCLLILPLWLALTLLPVLTASAVYCVRRYGALLSSRSVTTVAFDGSALCFGSKAGEELNGVLLGTTFVSPHLTIVALQPVGLRFPRYVLLTADNTRPEDFRRLRVALRWNKREVADDQSYLG